MIIAAHPIATRSVATRKLIIFCADPTPMESPLRTLHTSTEGASWGLIAQLRLRSSKLTCLRRAGFCTAEEAGEVVTPSLTSLWASDVFSLQWLSQVLVHVALEVRHTMPVTS